MAMMNSFCWSVLLLPLTLEVGGFSSLSDISLPTTRTAASAPGGYDRSTKPWPLLAKTFVSGYCSNTQQDSPVVDVNKSGERRSPLFSDNIIEELQSQNPNEDAPVYDFNVTREETEMNDEFMPMSVLDEEFIDTHKYAIQNNHFETRSLDDLFPELQSLRISEKFNTCAAFRNGLQDAIRHDMIFDSNADCVGSIKNQPPIYAVMSDQERYRELAQYKPLIGHWKYDDDSEGLITTTTVRMTKTTRVLRQYLGPNGPTGDKFLEAIGSLCNSTQSPYHWTEVVGVSAIQSKRMGDKTEHAWHQDYGHLEDRKTHAKATPSGNKLNKCENDSNPYQSNSHVFFAFPYEDNYNGTGALPHIIKLKHEHWAKPKNAVTPGASTFYRGTVPERYIVRPRYVPGRELIIFRDIDVLHSTPDIQYRTTIMRFG